MNIQSDRARNVGMTCNSGMATAALPRSTQVELMLSNLSEEIGMLEKALELHVNKITPVLIPEAPCETNKCEPPKEALVPVANSIRSLSERVAVARKRVESLTERVEA